MCEWVNRYVTPAARHRRAAIVTAWMLCLTGWIGAMLLPLGPTTTLVIAPALDPGGTMTRPAASDERPPATMAAAPPTEEDRDQLAALRADLDAALTLRATHAQQLAAVPRLIGDRPNPIRRQRVVQLDQQDALIAALRHRLAGLRAPLGHPAGPPQHPHDSARLDHPAPGNLDTAWAAAQPTASAPAGPIAAPRFATLLAVLVLGTIAGAALAVWRGQHDDIVDHPGQLQPNAALAVVCSIVLPIRPAPAREDRSRRKRAVLACLGLVGLFATLVVADWLDVLAVPGEGLSAGWQR
jgi:hypothetical protein